TGLPTEQREAAVNRLLSRLALADMRARPVQTMWLKIRYAAYFFWPRVVPTHVFTDDTRLVFLPAEGVEVLNSPPRSRIEALAFSTSYCPIALAAVVGIWRRGRNLRRDALLWAILGTFVVVHTIYFPATRYTTPTAFVLLFYAAVALTALRDSN